MEIDDWVAIVVGIATVVVALLTVYLSYRAQLKVTRRDRMLGQVSNLMAEVALALNAVVLSARVAEIRGIVFSWKDENPPSVKDANHQIERLNVARSRLGEPEESIDLAGPAERKLGTYEIPIVTRFATATQHRVDREFQERDDQITRAVVSAVMAGLSQEDRLAVMELQGRMGKLVREAKREDDCQPLVDEITNLEKRLHKAVG